MRLPWESHDQSQETNWRYCVTGPELSFFQAPGCKAVNRYPISYQPRDVLVIYKQPIVFSDVHNGVVLQKAQRFYLSLSQ